MVSTTNLSIPLELKQDFLIDDLTEGIADDYNPEGIDFYDNLVDSLDDASLNKLSSFLLTEIQDDISKQKPWLDAIEKVIHYLGFDIEGNVPFGKKGCSTFDTTLSTALIRFYAIIKPLLFPPEGPAGYRVIGESTSKDEDIGERRRDWLNYCLTVKDKAYYPDADRFIFHLGIFGSLFRKVYFDKILNMPISRYIRPKDFIVNKDCTTILESNSITHILRESLRDVILKQQNGIYKKIDLEFLKNSDKKNTSFQKDNKDSEVRESSFEIYENHRYLSLEEFNENNIEGDNKKIYLPKPYIIHIDKDSKKILSIRRNWRKEDTTFKRIEYFIQYNYLPGFDLWGIGLGRLGGTNAITLTALQRMLVDSGTFKNIPGGLIANQGIKSDKSTQLVSAPGEFLNVQTNGQSIQDVIMPLPYNGADPTLRELRLEIVQSLKEQCSTSELGMMDSREDIPTGTALAFLESNNKIQSAVSKSIHYSLTQELQMLDKLYSENIEYEEFETSNKKQYISSFDFIENVNIIPVADPSSNSNLQKTMRAEYVLNSALKAPELHNMNEIYRMCYKSYGIDSGEIDKILIPEQDEQEQPLVVPLDPITENMNCILGKGLKVAEWQDHASHILVHTDPNYEGKDTPEMKAHIKEHIAQDYLNKMQLALNVRLPSIEELANPEIQNQVALEAAKIIEQMGVNTTDSGQEIQGLNPDMLLAAEIEQKKEETLSKERIANTRAETEIFKSQLRFEESKNKVKTDKEIAELKIDADIEKEQLKVNGI